MLPPARTPTPDAREPRGTDDAIFSVAIVGRPNVGKSTLFNRLVGDDRSVVHDMPGTTRDTIDTIVETDDGPLRFVDTAGLRRQSRVDEPTEYYSLVRALEAVDRADAALLVIDATEGVTHQDQRLAERIDAAGTAIVDRAEQVGPARHRGARAGRDRGRRPARLPRLRAGAPDLRAHRQATCTTCCPRSREAETAYHCGSRPRRSTGCIRDARSDTHRRSIAEAPAPHPVRDAGRDRPADVHAVRHAGMLPPTYLRYIERKIREAFDLGPTPIKIRVRRRARVSGPT